MVVGQEVWVLDIEQSDKPAPRTERSYFDFVQPDPSRGEGTAGDNWRGQTSKDVEIANECR